MKLNDEGCLPVQQHNMSTTVYHVRGTEPAGEPAPSIFQKTILLNCRRKTIEVWKMNLHRRKMKGINNAKKSLRVNDVVKESRSAPSTIGVDVNSCLKKPNHETDNSVADGNKSESVSTGVDSVNEITVTTCASSSGPKTVRFDVVEIRNYERIASDNPCCSSGPPIG